MSEKTNKIIYWALTGLFPFVFLVSAIGKLNTSPESLKMAEGFGIDPNTYLILGIIEIICLTLFVIPRTGVVGTILLASYMGGAIATHLEHNVSIIAPVIVQTFMLIVSFYRFPVLHFSILNSMK